MHETVLHLVKPVLSRLEHLLSSPDMDPSWWILLFYRGFHNDTTSVKKGILEYIFTLQNKQSLNMMGIQRDFVFGALLKTIDVTSLYAVPTQGTLVSPFGEKIKLFVTHLLGALERTEDKVRLNTR